MAITTSQQIQNFYAHYKDIEVTFTRDVINAIKLVPKQIYFKCLGNHWPCIIYSASMSGARLIANLNELFYEQIKKSGNIIQLRFAFKQEDKTDLLSFFISCKISGFTPYNHKSEKDINFINTAFTQKPPDSLIEILGNLLDATADSQKRKEERITLTPDVFKALNIMSKESILYVENVPRKCLLRDLSFSGAKVIVSGLGRYLLNKPAVLKIAFEDATGLLELKGIIIRDEEVSGRKDLIALALKFEDSQIPIAYKMKLNQFFRHMPKVVPKNSTPEPNNAH